MPVIHQRSFLFVLIQHFFRLEADSQSDRPAGHILPEAIPTHRADAGGQFRVIAGVELDACANGTEAVEPQDVVLVAGQVMNWFVPSALGKIVKSKGDNPVF